MRETSPMAASKPWQPGIFEGIPPVARYVWFALCDPKVDVAAIREALQRLTPLVDGSDVVVGLGPSLVRALGAEIPNLHEVPDFSRGEVKVAPTPGTLWCWLRGSDLGDLLHVTRKVQKALAPVFTVRHVVDAFRLLYRMSLDRTESREAFYREDYPDCDDEEWFCWHGATRTAAGPVYDKERIPIERFGPKATLRPKHPSPIAAIMAGSFDPAIYA